MIPFPLINSHPGLCARHKFNQGNECRVEVGVDWWVAGWGGDILRLQKKKFNLFFSFQGWEPKCHSRTHTHPCKHLSICQISTPIVPLACWRDVQQHSSNPLPPSKHRRGLPLLTFFAPTTPRLPNLIKLINSFPPFHQFHFISFGCLCLPRPRL